LSGIGPCGRPGTTSTLTIVDAYCGVGTFAKILSHHVGKVIAIEESASAIKDAQWNVRDIDNIEILQGKVEDILPTLSLQIDGFVIDPPRAGCQQSVLDTLVNNPVPRIVYVSCDPSTLARDLHILCHINPTYQLRSVQPLDMFPQTAHIECVAVLEHVPA
jgi:23S rRNA (uracil1939-C5)-methyltransferase